jgi:hypothetical protein
MPESTRDGQRRVALFVRDDLPEPVQHRLDGISAQLEQLVAAGEIDSYAVRRWSKRQPFDAAAPSQRSRYASFDEWARTTGVRLTPGFHTRECYSMETGECERSLVVPVVCLAVYDGDAVDAVYPHVGTEPRTVEDGLTALSSTANDSTTSMTFDPSAAD